jgi:hypothetical protein
LLGGIIGTAVDQADGKAYNLPEWVQIVMGKMISFDRNDHVAGKPNLGKETSGMLASGSTGATAASDSAKSPTDSNAAAVTPVVVDNRSAYAKKNQ